MGTAEWIHFFVRCERFCGEVRKIDKFTKWFVASFVLGLAGLITVFFVEDMARVNGEMDKNILLGAIITIFILNLFSMFSLVKANSNRNIRGMVASALIAVIPLFAFAINSLFFIVYFVGK